MLGNAIQEALQQLECWEPWLKQLKSVTRVFAEDSWKEVILEQLRNSEADTFVLRRQMHRFTGGHVEWRWECLEDVTSKVDQMIDDCRLYINFDELQDEIARIILDLKQTIFDDDWREMNVAVNVFLQAAGVEFRWFETYWCHL